jgi:hypothetical protein
LLATLSSSSFLLLLFFFFDRGPFSRDSRHLKYLSEALKKKKHPTPTPLQQKAVQRNGNKVGQ